VLDGSDMPLTSKKTSLVHVYFHIIAKIDCQLNIVHKFTVKHYMLGFSPEAGESRWGITEQNVYHYSALFGWLLDYSRGCVKEDEGELSRPCEQCISHL